MSDPRGERPETPDVPGTETDPDAALPGGPPPSDADEREDREGGEASASAVVPDGRPATDDGPEDAREPATSTRADEPGDEPDEAAGDGTTPPDDEARHDGPAGDAGTADSASEPGDAVPQDKGTDEDEGEPAPESPPEATEPADAASAPDEPHPATAVPAPPADEEPVDQVPVDEVPAAPTPAEAPAGSGPEDGPRDAPGHEHTPGGEHETETVPVPGAASGPGADHAPADGEETAASGWRRLGAALRPRASRSQVLAGVLCAALGFALVVQVQQSASDQLSSARQEDLVRLLDEVTDRAQQLGDEVSGLEATRDELESGTGQARSALELAEQRAESEGILSGRLPAQGPGVRVTVQDPAGALKASQMFNVLEELRNAGAEVVELNGVRLVTSTWFEDEGGAIVVDGTALSSPYEWTVIGDPETMDRALEIPGGALATVRTAGAEASTAREDEVKITAVTPPQEPEHAQPERARD
ncbi:DUF881 domain-containing protein [Isoptericola sp. NPDC019693]|uniref:DUF881 domain-containing protein n=1 Tax=Isoptericola sp. NPDC019693 TaxID=3364009 RepID=UPI003789618F